MRLAKLTATGFKSFGDKTEIAFDHPVTGIVGPNGCGKSNVVDAIKWVLGSQSAKSLRGGAMLDVIFNGTSTRKPAGMASVTLTFDNKDRTLGLDLDTVSVTRQLYRDGSSEYLINKQRCRLRDIKELFMDTGIGTEAYSIIEQGKVARMLETNASERREIFEEAAGISRFKARKKESIRKLERIEQNLNLTRTRLGDIQRRLRSVKIQAGRARTFKEYSERLNELQLTYALVEYHKLKDRLTEVAEQLEQAEADRAAAARKLSEHEQQISDTQIERESVTNQQKQIEHERLQKSSERDQAEQRRSFAEKSLEDLNHQIERDQKQLDELAARCEQLAEELTQHAEQIEQLNMAQAEAGERLETAEQQHRSLQHQLNEKQSELEDEKAGVISLMRRSAQLNNEISSLENFQQNLMSTREKLGRRASEVSEELERLLTMRDQATEKHDEANSLIEAQNEKLDQIKQQASQLDTSQRELTEKLAAAKEERARLESRRSLLQEMEDRQEGLADPVKAVLARKASDEDGTFAMVRGLLAEMFETDVDHAAIVEAALGDYQQALVIDSLSTLTDHGHEAISALAGRVTFVAIDQFKLPPNVHEKPPAGLQSVIDFVRYPGQIGSIAWGLLSRTLVTADLSTARRLRMSLPNGYRFVTMNGELVEADGRVTAGPTGAAGVGGLISRRSELAQLNTQLTEQDETINVDTQSLGQLSDRASHIEALSQELRQGIYEANAVRVELGSRLESLHTQISKLEREQPVIAAETEQIHRQLHDADQKRQTHASEAEELDRDSTDRQQSVERLQREIDELKTSADEARETVTSSRVELTKTSEQLSATQRQLRQLEIARADVDRQRGLLQNQITGHRERTGELKETMQSAQQQTLAAQARLDQLEASLSDVHNRVVAIEAQLDQLRSAMMERRSAVEQVDQQIQQLHIDRREVEVKIEGVCERANEQLGLNVVEAYAQAMNPQPVFDEAQQIQLEEPTNIADTTELVEFENEKARLEAARAEAEKQNNPLAGFDPDSLDWEAVETEIKTLREKLARLGNVNLDAINEQGELEDQNQNMEGQIQDIEQAKLDLEQLIKQINEDSRKRFETCFNEVREAFAGQDGLFRKLFGGGRADLFLQPDEEGRVDVLESGIEIIAKPPGKEPQSISLLSGGEKTMTAVALLLSIFKTKPSPFAVLDEVDAALDESNVHRFAQIIKSFLDRSHFIVITHNKGTMQVCDVLWGITMQERGVSKRVSVQFDQIGSAGQISKDAIAKQDATDAAAPPEVEEEQVAPEPAMKSSSREHLAAMLEGREPVEVEQPTETPEAATSDSN